MRVRDRRHSVDLEVFVRTDRRDGFNRAPVGERRLSIVEPLVADVLDQVVIDIGNSSCDLSARHSPALQKEVLANVLVLLGQSFDVHQVVVDLVTATDAFDIVQVVAVDSRKADTTVVHLSGEDLVAEEVVSKDTAVRVSEVFALSPGDIRQVAEKGVHRVVLFLDIIEMLSVVLNVVGAEHVLEQIEGIVVLILDRGSIVENSNIRVVHLIVTDHENGRAVDGLLGVLRRNSAVLGKSGESLRHCVTDGLMANVTSGNDSHVVSIEVGSVELTDLIDA